MNVFFNWKIERRIILSRVESEESFLIAKAKRILLLPAAAVVSRAVLENWCFRLLQTRWRRCRTQEWRWGRRGGWCLVWPLSFPDISESNCSLHRCCQRVHVRPWWRLNWKCFWGSFGFPEPNASQLKWSKFKNYFKLFKKSKKSKLSNQFRLNYMLFGRYRFLNVSNL